jgi:nucleotide-binding universal stress UspA family protein
MSSVGERSIAPAARREPILGCYDDSPGAVLAIEAAADLLGPRRAVVLGVGPWMTAAESVAATSSAVPGNAFAELNEAEARRVARRGVEVARSAGFEEPRGEPASTSWHAIADVAHELDVALIAIGSRGRTGMKKLFDTSLPEQVADRARRPVPIVPPPR